MKQTIAVLTIATAALIGANVALADTPSMSEDYVQQGLSYRAIKPTPKTFADTQRELAEFKANPVSADGLWKYSDYKGWETIPGYYDFQNGRLVFMGRQLPNSPNVARR